MFRIRKALVCVTVIWVTGFIWAPHSFLNDSKRTFTTGEMMAENNKDGGEPDDADAQKLEAEIDETLEDSFPASDPPSWTLGTDHQIESGVDASDDETAE